MNTYGLLGLAVGVAYALGLRWLADALEREWIYPVGLLFAIGVCLAALWVSP